MAAVIKEQAKELFEKRGLPTKEDEAFCYFPVSAFRELPLIPAEKCTVSADPYLIQECQTHLVFVDGYFDPLQSRMALPLQDAMRTYGHFLKSRFAKLFSEENDPLALLNAASHQEGAFLYLPPKTKAGPIQVVFLSTQDKASFPRLHVFAGAYAEAEIFITNIDAQGAIVIPAVDFALEEGASIRVQSVIDSSHWHLASLRATLKKDARFSHYQWNKGDGIARSDTHVWLQGEGAQADLKGIWMLQNKAQVHALVRVDHQAPHCQSMQLFKGVLSGLSRSSFEGKIYVHSEAQKTQAYQLNKNLLLSPHVIAHAKPNLEIFADDVKASHGATVAHLDDQLLFYLKSRGIAESQAKSLLVEGFCREVLDQFILPSLGALHAIRNYLE